MFRLAACQKVCFLVLLYNYDYINAQSNVTVLSCTTTTWQNHCWYVCTASYNLAISSVEPSSEEALAWRKSLTREATLSGLFRWT